jgi:large subunit ribosomal protein L2
VLDVPAKVQALEYDPNRTAHIALVEYRRRQALHHRAQRPEGGRHHRRLGQGDDQRLQHGNNFPLSLIPPSTRVHCVELLPGKGAQMARTAGLVR